MFTRVCLFLALLLILFFVVPNVINSREKRAYSDQYRIAEARKVKATDSVTVPVSTFYERGSLIRSLFGSHYRDIWNTPVSFKVFYPSDWQGGLKAVKTGGGDQTISVDMVSADGHSYTLRTVDKDQSRALPGWLYYSLARPLFRDQTSALNPYAAPVVAQLAEQAGILHTDPLLFYIPFQTSMDSSYRALTAGRVMLLEEEPDMTWSISKRFGDGDRIIDSDELLNAYQNQLLGIDSLEFARCRLFDIVIGDWDRHEGQWAWSVDSKTKLARPIPMDRDMAFYKFKDGVINRLALKVNGKLQTYDSLLEDVDGYFHNGLELDTLLLKHLTREQWMAQADSLKKRLTSGAVHASFERYPAPVYRKTGQLHERIFKDRLNKLPAIAESFYKHVNKK